MDSVAAAACLQRMNEMRKEHLMCDLKLIALGKKAHTPEKRREFAVHRNVLAAASPHFDAMFNSSFKEARKDSVALEMDGDVLELLIQYMYTFTVDLDAHNARRVLAEANYLELTALVARCEHFLLTSVSAADCLGTWQLARLHSSQQLQRAALNTALLHFDKVVDSPELLTLCADDIKYLISHKGLRCKESSVFRAIIKWCEYDTDRNEQFARLLSCVRLSCLDSSFLLDTVGRHPLVLSLPAARKHYDTTIQSLVRSGCAVGVRDRVGSVGWTVSTERWTDAPAPPEKLLTNGQPTAVAHGSHVYFASDTMARLETHKGEWQQTHSPAFTASAWKFVSCQDVLYALTYQRGNLHMFRCDAPTEQWIEVLSTQLVNGTRLIDAHPLSSDLTAVCCLGDRIAALIAYQVYTVDPLNTRAGWLPMCTLDDVIGCAMCSVAGRLFFIGHTHEDYMRNAVPTSNVFNYDEGMSRWVALAQLPGRMCDVCVCEWNGRLVVCGRIVDSQSASRYNEVLMLNEGAWQRLLPTRTSHATHCAIACKDNILYLIDGSKETATVETLLLEGDQDDGYKTGALFIAVHFILMHVYCLFD